MVKKTLMKNGDFPSYLFHQGTNYQSYKYLGVHKNEEKNEYIFRVWAPHADRIFVVGDFNDWGDSVPMLRVTERGIWEVSVSSELFGPGSLYKFKIIRNNCDIYKADPYAFYAEKAPQTASVYFESNYTWHDAGWCSFRHGYTQDKYSKPLNIYELHLGSWKLRDDGTCPGYAEIAEELAAYVKSMGYTHIELMPIAEHPYDGSWGYQVCGYYAPSSRWGTPDDFRKFVDIMHGAGIGVILDWVPAHFPKDSHGLYEFDGEPLYEYQGIDRMEHAGWGTRRFDVGREEVQCFLISNAVYWAEEFHIDGLRVDAVSSMLYLDYDKKPGEWIPNVYGDNRCLEAVAFFKKLNSAMINEHPDVMMIAEESTAWPHITGFDNDGLGFTYKWNMGWMNDTLNYAETDTYFRGGNHSKLTFPICYSFSEKYILPISHDEVVHGKKSFLDKMPGEYGLKFDGTRLFEAYRMCFPGKKLMFMGQEIGQFREWDHAGQIEWFLLKYPSHSGLHRFFKDLNHFYLSHAELWELDDSFDGFSWILPDRSDLCVTAFKRFSRDHDELTAIFNFVPVKYDNMFIPTGNDDKYTEVFNTDRAIYGGRDILNDDIPNRKAGAERGISVTLPPLSAIILKRHKK